MRTSIGIAIVVAIGLIWAVTAMSGWLPVNSVEMSVTTPSHAITVGQANTGSH